MSEIKDVERALYNDMRARPDFYKPEWGFDPLQYLRKSTDEEGRVELSLDIKYRKHWFRLVCPHGQIRVHEKAISKESAMFTVRVYADKGDSPESFLAEGTAIRYYGTTKPYERFYVDWAETMATGRALTSAGFDVPWCNKPTEEGALNLYTGETITYDDDAAPETPAVARKYSSLTDPPDQGPALELPGQQQLGASAGQRPPAAEGAPAHQASAPEQMPPAAPQTPAPQAPPPAQSAQVSQAPPAASIPAGSIAPRSYDEAMAAMTVEQAKAIVVTFNGKNKGKTLGQVAEESPADIDWIIKKYLGKDFLLKAGAQILADAAIRQAS